MKDESKVIDIISDSSSYFKNSSYMLDDLGFQELPQIDCVPTLKYVGGGMELEISSFQIISLSTCGSV